MAAARTQLQATSALQTTASLTSSTDSQAAFGERQWHWLQLANTQSYERNTQNKKKVVFAIGPVFVFHDHDPLAPLPSPLTICTQHKPTILQAGH
jgi:hypothetical protein